MSRLTPRGERFVEELAQRHGFSNEAVTHMLMALRDGNAGMAQFSHPEFGGYGQWMRGGMLMLGDMFNHTLKARVDALCAEIADRLAMEPELMRGGSFQSQRQEAGAAPGSSQSADPARPARAAGEDDDTGLFAADPARHWWPAELGTPNATCAQNHMRYAYFADARRLAIEVGGVVWVYDTGEHRIGGFSSQQRGGSGSITLTSQYGTVDLAQLRVVSRNGQPMSTEPAPAAQAKPAEDDDPSDRASPAGNDEIFTALERLGDLKAKGILSEEEFAAKKAELLARL
ncbi:SHOCT domain-containing protein [Halomonas sp. HP20-15]|uniref:SHOCT domain-containing protein n=1 Tax=Halomonas sp. HP20-15 TaxID=3085901 RepID=UPI00298237D9|nr:SHOCT domain-containing protein [Halomonas sp. HP20-15]MDW5377667.1 SHOCT domain-containing protein [Halomonas sp. HP20-15]